MAEKQVVTRPGGSHMFTRDATANDSSKDFTVPTGKVWSLQFVVGDLGATATVGNRQLVVVIYNPANALIWSSAITAAITANNSGVIRASAVPGMSSTGLTRLTGLSGATVSLTDVLPSMFLPAGYYVRVVDVNAVDAAADDMVVSIGYIEYEA